MKSLLLLLVHVVSCVRAASLQLLLQATVQKGDHAGLAAQYAKTPRPAARAICRLRLYWSAPEMALDDESEEAAPSLERRLSAASAETVYEALEKNARLRRRHEHWNRGDGQHSVVIAARSRLIRGIMDTFHVEQSMSFVADVMHVLFEDGQKLQYAVDTTLSFLAQIEWKPLVDHMLHRSGCTFALAKLVETVDDLDNDVESGQENDNRLKASAVVAYIFKRQALQVERLPLQTGCEEYNKALRRHVSKEFKAAVRKDNLAWIRKHVFVVPPDAYAKALRQARLDSPLFATLVDYGEQLDRAVNAKKDPARFRILGEAIRGGRTTMSMMKQIRGGVDPRIDTKQLEEMLGCIHNPHAPYIKSLMRFRREGVPFTTAPGKNANLPQTNVPLLAEPVLAKLIAEADCDWLHLVDERTLRLARADIGELDWENNPGLARRMASIEDALRSASGQHTSDAARRPASAISSDEMAIESEL